MFITVIQITTTEAIIARFSKSRSGLEFSEGARHLLADSSLAEILPSWSAKCSSDRVILSLPPSIFSMREVDLPLSDRKKAREILAMELKGETAVESDELIFEAILLADGRCQALWSSASRLAPSIAMLAQYGLDPEVVTSSLFCWNQLLPKEMPDPVALADSEALVIYKEGKPLYLRAFPESGENRISATLVAAELSKGISVEQLSAVGGELSGEGEHDFTPLLAEGEYAAAFNADPVAARDLATPYAVAAAFLAGDPVNFRRSSLVFTRNRTELQKRLKLTGVLVAIALVLLFAEAFLRYYLVKKDLASLDISIRKIYNQAFPKRTKPVDEVAELRAEIRRMGAASPDGILIPLKKLAEAKGEELNELYEIDIDGVQITGKGIARSVQGVNDFKAKGATFFSTVEVNEIKSRPDGSTGFSFRAGIKEVGK